MKLSELIKQDQFVSPAQESMLNILVTGSWITGEMAGVMGEYGITPAQYNVLRILKGSAPETLTCSEISERLLDRTPDVTRLLNRLQRNGLIHRARAEHDRRVVQVSITEEGAALLQRMAPAVAEVQRGITGQLTDDEHRQLADLLERLRSDQRA